MKKFLKKFDGLWAMPLAFFVFALAGFLIQYFSDGQSGAYDLAFLQPIFLSITIVIGTVNAVVWGMYFTFKDLHQQIYSKKGREQFNELRVHQKLYIALIVFFILFFSIIFVYINLI